MRWILPLLLCASFALAQKAEPIKPELEEIIKMLRSDDADKVAEAKRRLVEMTSAVAVVATQSGNRLDVRTSAASDELINEIARNLNAGNLEAAKDLVEKFRKKSWIVGTPPIPFIDGAVVLVGPTVGGGELLTGSTDVNGVRTDYRLTSLGKGRYTLKATTTDAEGNASKTNDAGTLAELRNRYAFLKEFDVTIWPRLRAAPGARIDGRSKAQTIRALGLTVDRPCEELRWHFYIPPGVGFVVRKVEPDSVAERIGIRPFDVLLTIDGDKIEGTSDLLALAGARGKLGVIRRSQKKDLPFPAKR